MPDSQRLQFTSVLRLIAIGCIVLFLCFIFTFQGMFGSGLFDCPRQPFISVYLSLYGIIPIFLTLSLWLNWCNIVCWFTTIIFLLCWLIAGSISIYSIYEPNYIKNITQPDLYCNKSFYLFAFWSTNATYILLGLLFFPLCCCRRGPDDDNEAQRLVQE